LRRTSRISLGHRAHPTTTPFPSPSTRAQTLEELGTPYTFKETSIAPGTKPAWFTEVYQKAAGAAAGSDGKVPVLVEGEYEAPSLILAESSIIAEYVAEKFGPGAAAAQGGLLPATPLERAETALFLSQTLGTYISAFYGLMMAQEVEAQAKQKAALLAACASVSEVYGRRGGPYLLGERVTLGDVNFWPFVERLSVNAHYRGFEVPDEPAYANFHRFAKAMREREAVKRCAVDVSVFIEGYAGYANPPPKAA
jgi:glutathione S-transferase